MRIAVITQYWPTSAQPWGGHSAYQTVRILAERHQVRVFYPESRYPSVLTPGSRIHGHLDPSYQPQGVTTEYIPYPALPLLSRPINGWMMYRRLLPRVRDFAPDLLLNYVVYPDGYAAVMIAKALGKPVVLTAIGSDLNRIPDALCARHTRTALRSADFVTTVSKDLLRTARNMDASLERSSAIVNGCDTSVFHPRSREESRRSLGLSLDSKIVVYVGRLDLRKGLLELVEATARANRTDHSIQCYLVGEGSDRASIEAAIRQYDSTQCVHFVAPVDTRGVARWMSASDLVTLPSYAEGCPNVIIEALASGRPVVATNVGGIPELVTDESGALIQPRDVDALTEALTRVLNSSWDAEQLGAAHSRSWHDVAAEVDTVLREVSHATRRD